MSKPRHEMTTLKEDPREILGVAPNAGDAEVRAAYLRKVKENPPDRSPSAFERVRDAYEILRDPRRRALYTFLSIDPAAPLVSLLPPQVPERRFVGPEPWLAALKEK